MSNPLWKADPPKEGEEDYFVEVSIRCRLRIKKSGIPADEAINECDYTIQSTHKELFEVVGTEMRDINVIRKLDKRDF